MTETQKKSGIVAGVNAGQGKYGFTLESDKNTWYNGKGTCPCQKGDQVDVKFVVNGQWNNIEQVYKSEEPPRQSQPAERGYSDTTMIKTFSGLTLSNLEYELNAFNRQHKVIATQTHLNNHLYDAIVYYK